MEWYCKNCNMPEWTHDNRGHTNDCKKFEQKKEVTNW